MVDSQGAALVAVDGGEWASVERVGSTWSEGDCRAGRPRVHAMAKTSPERWPRGELLCLSLAERARGCKVTCALSADRPACLPSTYLDTDYVLAWGIAALPPRPRGGRSILLRPREMTPTEWIVQAEFFLGQAVWCGPGVWPSASSRRSRCDSRDVGREEGRRWREKNQEREGSAAGR